jgi:hypothetical protein
MHHWILHKGTFCWTLDLKKKCKITHSNILLWNLPAICDIFIQHLMCFWLWVWWALWPAQRYNLFTTSLVNLIISAVDREHGGMNAFTSSTKVFLCFVLNFFVNTKGTLVIIAARTDVLLFKWSMKHITNKYILCALSSLNIQMAKENDRRVNFNTHKVGIIFGPRWALCENIMWMGSRGVCCAYINVAEMDAGDSTKENLRIESDQYQTRIMKK